MRTSLPIGSPHFTDADLLSLSRAEGSMLCGQHALNNLLQSSLFTAPDLADIARQLDTLEQAQLDPGTRLRGDEDGMGQSANYDDSGFFSVQGEPRSSPRRVGNES